MKVVLHQHVGMDAEAKTLGGLAEQLQEVRTVRIVAVDGLAFIATSRDVVAASRPFDAQCACHGQGLNQGRAVASSATCQLLRCDPCVSDCGFVHLGSNLRSRVGLQAQKPPSPRSTCASDHGRSPLRIFMAPSTPQAPAPMDQSATPSATSMRYL